MLDMSPTFPRAQMIVYAYVEEGRFPEAARIVEGWKTDNDAPWGWPMSGYIYGRWGKQHEAQQAMQETLKIVRKKKFEATIFVVLYIGMGNKEQALTWLEKAYAEHTPNLNAIKVDPTYDSLRSEPRFQALLKQLHLDH